MKTCTQPEASAGTLRLYSFLHWDGFTRDDVVAYSVEDAHEVIREQVGPSEWDGSCADGMPEIKEFAPDEVVGWVYVDEPGQPKDTRTAAEVCRDMGRGYAGGCA